MKLGVGIFPTDLSISPVALAKAAEDHGFESFWVPEHSHIPLAETAFPGGREVGEMYKRSLDPFVTLGVVAGATSSIKIGTGICLVVQRDPIITAKEVATLDVLSGGRFLFGVGGGWNRAEMMDHGTDPSTRFALMAERIEAMKVIWTSDTPSYHGRFVDFDPMYCWPKPVQSPHPPVLVGGNGARTLERVVEYGDEWMPNAFAADAFASRITELQSLAAAAGRSPIPVSAFGCRPDAAAVDRYAGIGVTRCTFWMPSEPADVVLPMLDDLASTMSEWLAS
jgi:probable F420-dependent oxidoreductase